MTKPVCVAVVDDDLPVRTALARLLSANFYSPTTYESAKEFIKSLSTATPACAVVDLHMPDMNGLELQSYMAGAGIHIPVVVITAHDEPGIREQCLAAGAVAYLLKPLPDNGLITAVKNAVSGEFTAA
jgi:FixJ family two-component response regulator